MSESNDTIARIKSDYMKQYDAQLRREKRRRKRLFRRIMASVLFVTLVLGSLTLYHFKQRSVQAEIKTEYNELEKEMAKLEKEEKNLTEEISLLKNDEYVLDLARTNYFLSQEDELIFLTEDVE
ncbi:MAG TPA: septum formation initiator family protein [Pseudogracilibacillus sp.]|nr:septum formation initiator family protein [Pseudogracilibacillus sp.]